MHLPDLLGRRAGRLLPVFAILAGLALLIASPTQAFAQNEPVDSGESEIGDQPDPLVWDGPFSIEVFLRNVAAETGGYYMYQPNEISQISVHLLSAGENNRLTTPEAKYNFLLALLKQAGFTISEFGDDSPGNVKVYTIQRLQAQTTVGLANKSIDELEETANFISMIVHLRHAEPNSVQRALLNLATRPGGVIQPILGVNALLISDYEYQIKRMAQLLQVLDQPGPSLELAVIPVLHAEASELAGTVSNLVDRRLAAERSASGQQPQASDQILIEADSRTNALIVQATEDNIRLVRQLINRLDIKVDQPVSGRIHIYTCRHADAVELQETLQQVVDQEAFLQRNRDDEEAGQPGQPQPGQDPSQPRFRPSTSEEEEYQISIVADEATNALIITATPQDYLEIRKILNQLDIRKPQVMIEAAILEVNAEDSLEFGIELAAVDSANGDLGIFATSQFGFSDIVDQDGVPITGAGGVPRGKVPNFGNGATFALSVDNFFTIPALVRAVESVTDSNILSQPRLLTNDNEEATLEIQRGEPTITTTTTQSLDETGFGGYEDAGITFVITPQISTESGDYLRLEVELEVSDFAARAAGAPANIPPPRNTRRYQGEVTIPNGSTIVIGGLTQVQSTKTETKVPVLGDIPLLGELFKFRTTRARKTNLYLFIRPTILRDEDFSDLRRITNETLNRAEEEFIEGMTTEQRRFFDRAREVEESFGIRDEGRINRSYAYGGVDTNYAEANRTYTQRQERMRLEHEAEKARYEEQQRRSDSREYDMNGNPR